MLLVAYLSALFAMIATFMVLFVALPRRFDPDWIERRWGQYAHMGGVLFRALRTIEYASAVSSTWNARRALGQDGEAYGFGERAGPVLRVFSRIFLYTALGLSVVSVVAVALESLGIVPPIF